MTLALALAKRNIMYKQIIINNNLIYEQKNYKDTKTKKYIFFV